MSDLVVAPCSYEAAKFAVMNWHYSRVMPSGKLVKYGAWEDDVFVGSVIYGRGATPRLGAPYGLDQTQVCELVRVALNEHKTSVSKIIANTLRQLAKANPVLRLVVSFADSGQGHHGGIYQAGNWIYAGDVVKTYIMVNGVRTHPRSLGAKYGRGGQSISWLRSHVDPNANNVEMPAKHRYLYPLDKAMRRQVMSLSLPYPRASSVTAA
jgi:hypothetical protein